jgi:hypothetical protein
VRFLLGGFLHAILMSMKRVVKKYFIPHKGNNHTPHLLRASGIVGLLVIVVGAFALTLGHTVLLKNGNLAAVLSPVLIDLTNADRQANNLLPLRSNAVLAEAAKLKAEDMASKGYFAHNSPQGLSPWYWFAKVGYTFIYAGENLAINFDESTDVEKAWMDSPGHRANILNQHFTEIGIATKSGTYQGSPAIFVTQMFGTPLAYQKTTQPTPLPVAKSATTTITVVLGQVKSEATSSVPKVIPVPKPQVEVVYADKQFIAVRNAATSTSSSTPSGISDQTPLAGTTAPQQYASALEKILTQPKMLLSYVYSFIAALILLVMGLMIIGEYKRHHIKHITYGAGVLVTMAILMYILSSIIPHVIVV